MSKLSWTDEDLEETERWAEKRGARKKAHAITKALEDELEHATAGRHSKNGSDAMYDAGYLAGIEEAIRIASEDQA